MLQGRMDTGCACAGRMKRAQRPCVERERSSDDLSHRYGLPYDERGRDCVSCVALRAAVHGLNAYHVNYNACGGGRSLAGEIYKEFGVATETFAFWTVCRCNASGSFRE